MQHAADGGLSGNAVKSAARLRQPAEEPNGPQAEMLKGHGRLITRSKFHSMFMSGA
jgi:hypothetical protein